MAQEDHNQDADQRVFLVAKVAKTLGERDLTLLARWNSSFTIERRSAATLECGGSTPLWLQSPDTSRHDLATPPVL